ncbi:MAG: hypothetical protein QNJ12_14125 [Ilumatobacter sp.]|uniref:hypothetical protein n=1 Tax=Ilumatobacter sp. TaxID=1967498 RepID=UPI00260FC1F3|nr:hypothetical protein [Ilumatobacter sp.]MDJ0769934.1 hypothetical protein [Ilumatobacter sp.]
MRRRTDHRSPTDVADASTTADGTPQADRGERRDGLWRVVIEFERLRRGRAAYTDDPPRRVDRLP